MLRSAGFRFIIVGVLALLMFIPLGLVSDVIQERAQYSESTIRDISREWGGAQLMSGPILVVPVTEEVTYERKREAVDPVTGRTLRDEKNYIIYERYEETVTEQRAPVYLYPDSSTSTLRPVRNRGIAASSRCRSLLPISRSILTSTWRQRMERLTTRKYRTGRRPNCMCISTPIGRCAATPS